MSREGRWSAVQFANLEDDTIESAKVGKPANRYAALQTEDEDDYEGGAKLNDEFKDQLGGVQSAARQGGEHHNPGGGVRLTYFEGRRHGHSGHPVEDLQDGREPREQLRRFNTIRELEAYHAVINANVTTANVAEEIQQDANAVQVDKFGGDHSLIWDSGAGRSLCNKKHVPNYQLSHSDRPGFSGPSGETIKVSGRMRVHFTDENLGTTTEATFIVADKVTRPILSGGEINDCGNITISSARGAFVVSEEDAREACEALMPRAKLVFSRAGPGRLYEHESRLLPQPALFLFQGQV